MPIADVAIGEVGGSDEGLVGDGDPVVRLVLVADALKDFDRVSERGLVDLDRLEATLKCGVLFDVLAVLVVVVAPMVWSSPRASIGLRIDAASMAPSAAPAPTSVWISSMNSRMSPRVLISLSTFLEAFFEVTAVAAAGHKRAEVERVELLVGQRVGHVVVDDFLGKALDDRCLADSGLANEHRVVLCAARENLHRAFELFRATDHRIEFTSGGQLR